jgi:hypothetical protein
VGARPGRQSPSGSSGSLEAHFRDAVFDVRSDWPGGTAGWWETVRLGLR